MNLSPTRKLLVAIPYYNNPELLHQTLQAISAMLAGASLDIDFYISDDGSQNPPFPETLKLLPRLVYDRTPTNVGLVANYNRCVKKIISAAPNWSLILDSDDMPLPAAFETVVAQRESGAGVIAGGYEIVNSGDPNRVQKRRAVSATSVLMPPRQAFAWIFSRNRLASSGVWIHSDVYSKVGCYDKATNYCCDWDFYIRAFSEVSVFLSNQLFCRVLHHGGNNTFKLKASGVAWANERHALLKNWPLLSRMNYSCFTKFKLALAALVFYLKRVIG